MRIGIAARDLSRTGAGLGTYITNIAGHLPLFDKRNDYIIFCQRKDGVDAMPGALLQPLNSSNKAYWDYVLLPRAAKAHRVDLLFCPKNVLPFRVGGKTVIAVHDLAHFQRSLRAYKRFEAGYMRYMIRSSVGRVDGIIAMSENTKNDILSNFTLPERTKIRVIYPATDEAFKLPPDEKAVAACRNKFSLNGPFFFYAGSISPRKNLPRAVEAFARVADIIPHTFVITGGRRWYDKSFFDAVGNSGVASRIRILNYIDQKDIISLYRLADFSIYPSLYEGFGLPVIESMSCGCPVACADATSLPEAAGDAALLFDPYDVEAIAEAILRLATDEDTRSELRRKGTDQARLFSCSRVAEEMMTFFNEIGAE